MKTITGIIMSVTGLAGLLVCTASQAAIVGYDAGAPMGNFGSPTAFNNNVAYTTSVSADSTYAYFSFMARPDLGGSLGGLDFVNMYISTDFPEGSTIGVEVENNRAFVPGVNGYYDISGDGFVVTHNAPGEWNVAIPWTFFENDPQNMGFTKVTAANDEVRLNLCQAFGYSVAGGQASYGDERLGIAEMPAAPVPEPTTFIAGGLLLLPFGAGFLRKMRKA
jgi:hypothetical protein